MIPLICGSTYRTHTFSLVIAIPKLFIDMDKKSKKKKRTTFPYFLVIAAISVL